MTHAATPTDHGTPRAGRRTDGHRTLVEVGRPEQIEQLMALAAEAGIDLAVSGEEIPAMAGHDARRMIACDRANVLEELFGPALAGDVRDGLPLIVVLRRLCSIGEGNSDVADLVRVWIELDADHARRAGHDTGRPGRAGAAAADRPPGGAPAAA